MSKKINDLTNQRFGHLTVLEKTDKRYAGYVVWKCKCDCGNIVEKPGHNLLRGFTKTCNLPNCTFYRNIQYPKHRNHYLNFYAVYDDYMECTIEPYHITFKFDKEDFIKLNDYTWKYQKNIHSRIPFTRIGNTSVSIWKIILGYKNVKNKHSIKFKNGDHFDFRKENLELCW